MMGEVILLSSQNKISGAAGRMLADCRAFH